MASHRGRLWIATGLGLELASLVLGGVGVGYLLDKRLHSSPIGIVSGVILGSVLAMVQTFRYLRLLAPDKDTESDETPPPS